MIAFCRVLMTSTSLRRHSIASPPCSRSATQEERLMMHVRLCIVVLCSLMVLSRQAVYAQEGTPAADDEAPPVTCEGGYAPLFRLGGRVQSPKTFDLDALSQEPFTRVQDFFVVGQGTDSGTFTGVLLWDLLQEA